MKTKQYFLDRIGKRIYRNDSGCTCRDCKNIVENGLIINDEQHADYLFQTQNEYMAESIDLNYRDEK